MEFKQATIPEILDSEREMFLAAVDRYGDYFINAAEFNDLLNNFVKSVDKPDRVIFMLFYSQIKKHHTLALLSAARLHHIQTGMNLRQTIEAGQWATYALDNIEEEKFVEKKDGILVTTERHGKAMYKWLDANFNLKANEFRKMKGLISSTVAHASIVYAFKNFEMGPVDDPGFGLKFFDIEDDFTVKTDFWWIANAALGLLDLLHGANEKYKALRLVDDFMPRFQELARKNNELRDEMMKSERFKNIKK